MVDGAGDTIALSDDLLGLDPVTFTAPASGTYGVRIGGVAGTAGDYTLTLGETGSLLSAFDLPGEIARAVLGRAERSPCRGGPRA